VNKTQKRVRLPWFRTHIVLLNDPGRLISTHIMHTGLISGWAGSMISYELLYIDVTDPVYDPIWRQGCFVLPFASRLGVVSSVFDWTLGFNISNDSLWNYEIVGVSHIVLSGLLILASFWHWAYWDLEVFDGKLNLNRIFGIHLTLASILCIGFGINHLTGILGPGMWTTDSYGLVGAIRYIKPSYSIINLTLYSYGAISSHHIVAGIVGITAGLWHISSKPGVSLYNIIGMGNIEGVLASSIAAIFFITGIVQAGMWYGSVTDPVELFGTTRYQWDNAYYNLEIERRVANKNNILLNKCWEQIPDKLMLYDYIGSNPAKGGLFRSGPMIKADGVIQNWLGHASFEMNTIGLSVRRMPAFFEGFPVILIDSGGTLRADIPFRRASSSLSIEQTGVILYFLGGILSNTEYSKPSLVKSYARKALNGEIFTFDKKGSSNKGNITDGVWRTSPRGWYSFGHLCFAFIFFFGHLWHAGRSIFKDIWTGVSFNSDNVEYGRNEKLGDGESKATAII
jgi:photosystem II CP47 chlorophyll apoprotein